MTIVFFIGLLYLFYIMFNIHTQSLGLNCLVTDHCLVGMLNIYLGYIVIETALAMLYSVILSRVNAINGER